MAVQLPSATRFVAAELGLAPVARVEGSLLIFIHYELDLFLKFVQVLQIRVPTAELGRQGPKALIVG